MSFDAILDPAFAKATWLETMRDRKFRKRGRRGAKIKETSQASRGRGSAQRRIVTH